MQKMKTMLSILLMAATLVAVTGCGEGGASTTSAEEEAFKHPDKAKLPTPTAGTPMMEDKGKSSLSGEGKGGPPPGSIPGSKK